MQKKKTIKKSHFPKIVSDQSLESVGLGRNPLWEGVVYSQ